MASGRMPRVDRLGGPRVQQPVPVHAENPGRAVGPVDDTGRS
jgi:hypothetical protein